MKHTSKLLFAFSLLSLVFCLWSAPSAHANNVLIENPSLTDQDTTGDTYDIEFDISWDNSWRDASAPSSNANWDAVWVFAKYRTESGDGWGAWDHATLDANGHLMASGATFELGATGAVNVGAFIYRDAAGTGSNDWNNMQLRWDYGTDGVGDADNVQIKLFAVEMVYIPEGNFYIGDTDCDNEGNFEPSPGGSAACGSGTAATLISTAITSALCSDGNSHDQDIECTDDGNATGTFCVDGDGGIDHGCDGIENASFPTGYNAFYVMKYEVTQEQYRDFLNTLNGTQQAQRADTITVGEFHGGSTSPSNRGGIRVRVAPSGAVAGLYANDLTDDGIYNDSADGQWLAANWLSWMDGAAYADWAGLRPFTELEFEKMARGPQAAVDDEYAWGNASIHNSDYVLTGTVGGANEGVTPATNKGNALHSGTDGNFVGPARVGIFAASAVTKNRQETGSSYYGVMELSGNLWERSVTVGLSQGRSFTGTHGDGVLSTNGFATNSDWPGYDGDDVTGAGGSGLRGGSWFLGSSYARVSDRGLAAVTYSGRYSFSGVRFSRTSP